MNLPAPSGAVRFMSSQPSCLEEHMSEFVTLAVDAMGGDDAPHVVLEGVAAALDSDEQLKIMLCGPSEVVDEFANCYERCEAVPCTEVISMGEHPAQAVRKKKDSSIVRGCQLVRDGLADGFFSAGSTGACLAAATLIMGRISGIKRPALIQVLPSYHKPTLLVDVGANADCKPEYLVQFAQMGSIYMNKLMDVEDPSVGLLNLGSEESKGSEGVQKAYELLRSTLPSFKGNCEPGDLTDGAFDVVVTDGFTGNICLKTIEGTSKMLFRYIKDAFMQGSLAKIGAALVKGSLKSLKSKLSPDAYGGTPLLGVKGICIIGHGSSNPTAIKNGIREGVRAVQAGVVEVIESSAKDISSSPEVGI